MSNFKFFSNSTPVSSKDIKAVEKLYGVDLPKALKKLIKKHNHASWSTPSNKVDSLISMSGKDLDGIVSGIYRVPSGYLPFADDGAEGVYAVDTGGRVVHFGQDLKKTDDSPSFDEFVESLMKGASVRDRGMTEAFECGFLDKYAELRGQICADLMSFDEQADAARQGYKSVIKAAQESAEPAFVDTYGGRTAVSAGAGALLGALYEAAKDKGQKRHWLESIINGALGGAIAGAGTLAYRRNVLEPTVALGPSDDDSAHPDDAPGGAGRQDGADGPSDGDASAESRHVFGDPDKLEERLREFVEMQRFREDLAAFDSALQEATAAGKEKALQSEAISDGQSGLDYRGRMGGLDYHGISRGGLDYSGGGQSGLDYSGGGGQSGLDYRGGLGGLDF